MNPPSIERMNPRDVARATALTGRFHDVVTGAGKVLHGRDLEPRDAGSLGWARDLLEVAGSKDVVLSMPSAQQLSGPGSAVLALRRAARPEGGDPDEALAELRDCLDDALRGKRDEHTLAAMESLRDLFSLVSRFFLQAEITAQSERGSGRLWALSTTTSRL
jgi:hypothetical protein